MIHMPMIRYGQFWAIFLMATALGADEVLFRDDFKGQLGDGWRWIREHRPGWRTTEEGLEIRVEPGNMWGPANNASNILVRPVSAPESGSLQVSVTVSNSPTEQYEQVDLVWYYDDSRMVKLGLELVDGRLCIVMGREEGDKTRTIAIVPVAMREVSLRFKVGPAGIRGFFQPVGAEEWKLAGECDLPGRFDPRIGLQLYQGPAQAAHWARIRKFRIERLSENNR